MCGIAGIINLDHSESALAGPIEKMCLQMRNRGPDDEGYLLINKGNGVIKAVSGENTVSASEFDSSINYAPTENIRQLYESGFDAAFGHRRLSILDLTPSGHQPMCDREKKYWIVFNGEIYNYKEVRDELVAGGYNFIGNSDTEILLYAYIAWREDCLTRLNGMFAFAIYEVETGEVFLARDRIGIKPLYYTVLGNQLLFASNIQTLIASGLYKPEVNIEGLWNHYSSYNAPRPTTSFKDVYALEQAHWMRIKEGGITKQRYWKIPIGTVKHDMTEDEAKELIAHHLEKSVKYRMEADVEVCTFMSGGIDSTLVSAFAARTKDKMKAFTLGFDEKYAGFNEIEEAADTARMYDMNHIVEILNPEEALADINDMMMCFEEPYVSFGPPYIMSKVVSKHNVKVILNGLGGDELFCGYRYYGERLRSWQKFKRFAPLVSAIPNITMSGKIEAAKKIYSPSTLSAYYLMQLSTFTEFEKKRLFIDSADYNSVETFDDLYKPDRAFTDDLEGINYYDLMCYIGNHQVFRNDQFSMRFSLESRFPFLDHELITAAFQIPSKFKVKNNVRKHILKEVAKDYISPKCIAMKKKGFSLPMNHWIKNELKDFTIENLRKLKKRGLFNEKTIDKIYKQGNNRKIWHLVTTELWLQLFFDNPIKPQS